MEKKKEKVAIITMDVESPERFSENNLKLFFKLLDEYNLKATFFVTFNVAKHFPGIVELILQDGHEIASHGYTHPNTVEEVKKIVDGRTENDIIVEIENSKKFLEKFGVESSGIRLPAFTVNFETLGIISRYFKYDSSLTNEQVKGNFVYQNKRIKLEDGKELFEIPISTVNFFRMRLGTPVFFKLGARRMVLLIKWLGVSFPLLFYSHSFDLMHFDPGELNVKKWKKEWYYKDCSPDKIDFFRIFFEFLRRNNFTVLRCIDYIKK